MRTASIALAALLASTAAAGAVTFDLSNPTGPDLGLSHIYTAGGASITAYAEGGHLTAKNVLPDDIGLGLTSSPFGDGEITPGNWIAFDLSALAGDITFTPSSTGGGDIFHLYESATASVLRTSLFAGTGDTPIDVGPLSEPYLIVASDFGSASNDGVSTILAHLIEGSAASALPEPATLGLIGVWLLGMGLAVKWRGRPQDGRQSV